MNTPIETAAKALRAVWNAKASHDLPVSEADFDDARVVLRSIDHIEIMTALVDCDYPGFYEDDYQGPQPTALSMQLYEEAAKVVKDFLNR